MTNAAAFASAHSSTLDPQSLDDMKHEHYISCPTFPTLPLACLVSACQPADRPVLTGSTVTHQQPLPQGVLNFPSSACYVPLKSLAVGTLCKLCHTEPDVATLAMHLSLASALLQAVYDCTSTVYLKVCQCHQDPIVSIFILSATGPPVSRRWRCVPSCCAHPYSHPRRFETLKDGRTNHEMSFGFYEKGLCCVFCVVYFA